MKPNQTTRGLSTTIAERYQQLINLNRALNQKRLIMFKKNAK